MGIMDRQPTTDTPDLHMVTPLRPTGIGILITDHAHYPGYGYRGYYGGRGYAYRGYGYHR